MKEIEGAERLKRRGSKEKGRSGDNFKRRQASVKYGVRSLNFI
jgi:hypothetical protein